MESGWVNGDWPEIKATNKSRRIFQNQGAYIMKGQIK